MSKRRLGKGLGALFPEGEGYVAAEQEMGPMELPLGKIKANPHQPRKDFDEDKLKEMAETMANYGVIQPVIVQKRGDDYILVSGERRLRAASLAGLKTIPALVKDYPAEQLMVITLIENLQREDLNPMEEARAFQQLVQEYGLTQEELGARLGKSRSAIANGLRLLSLDPMVQNYLQEGILTPGQARPLLALTEEEEQRRIAAHIIEKQLNARQVERTIRSLKKQKMEVQEKEEEVLGGSALFVADLQEKMQKYYGTKVTIKKARQGGRVELHYYSEEDLERLASVLLAGWKPEGGN